MPIWTSTTEESFCGRRAENVYFDVTSDPYGNYLWSPFPEPDPIYSLFISYSNNSPTKIITMNKFELIEPLFQYWKIYGELFNLHQVELVLRKGIFHETIISMSRVTFPISRR